MDKNEELAKLLGVEPIIEYDCKDYHRAIKLGCDIESIDEYKEDCPNADYNTENSICENCVERIKIEKYPDFTKPSNFVKLLKLFVDNYATECCFTHIDEYDVMQECIDFIKENGFTKYCRNKFKQQAQQIKWEY